MEITLKWYTVILAIAIVVFLTLFAQKGIRTMSKTVLKKALAIKFYWQFSAIFIVLSIAVYSLIFNLVSPGDIEPVINLTNTALTLIFAIFVGYYAFMQVAESRLDKYRKEADTFLQTRNYAQYSTI